MERATAATWIAYCFVPLANRPKRHPGGDGLSIIIYDDDDDDDDDGINYMQALKRKTKCY